MSNPHPSDDNERLDLATARIGQLTESLGEVADFFVFWTHESPKLQITKHKEHFDSISEVINKTCTTFIQTVKAAETESEAGFHTSGMVIDLIGQLLDQKIPQEDRKDLITHLLVKIDGLRQAAARLKTEFSDIRGGFFWTKEQGVSLAAAVDEYRDAKIPWTTKFQATVIRRKSYRDAADPKKRAAAAAADSNLLEITGERLDRAIAITTRLVDDWAMLYSTIQHTSSDDLSDAKRAILKLQNRQWEGIREQYRHCASIALRAQGRLQVKDATKENLRVMAPATSTRQQNANAKRTSPGSS